MTLPPSPLEPRPLELEPSAHSLCSAISAIHQRGWCEGTGGNFSVVFSQTPLSLLMAPSGVDKGSVLPADLIVVDDHGRVIRGEGKASAETQLHLTIISSTGAGAVLHTHSQAATLLSRLSLEQGKDIGHLHLTGLEMLKGLAGIESHTNHIAIPILPNSQDLQQLSEAARPHLPQAPHGLLLAGHGLYAWGTSLREARRHLEILEFLLEQHWRALLLDALVMRKP